jgi:hypothetical protein
LSRVLGLIPDKEKIEKKERKRRKRGREGKREGKKEGIISLSIVHGETVSKKKERKTSIIQSQKGIK